MPSIEIRNLSFAYFTAPIFASVTARLAGPGIVAVLGASGSGKSTFLRLAAGLISPKGGEIRLLDHEGDSLPRVAWVPQDAGLFPWLTILENIEFPRTLATNRIANSSRKLQFEAFSLASELGIGHITSKLPCQVSGGQLQRAAIARSLFASAKILLLDEPFSSLDPPTRQSVRRLVRRVAAEHRMLVLIATHDLFDAACICDSAMMLSSTQPSRVTTWDLSSLAAGVERTPEEAGSIAMKLGSSLARAQPLDGESSGASPGD